MTGFLKRLCDRIGERIHFIRPTCDIYLERCRSRVPNASHLSLVFVAVRIKICRAAILTDGQYHSRETWGFGADFFATTRIMLKWGERYCFVSLPWHEELLETAVMTNDGHFVEKGKATKNDWVPQQFDFRYRAENGNEYETTAAVVSVFRKKWQWAILRLLRLPIGVKSLYMMRIHFADWEGPDNALNDKIIMGFSDYLPNESLEEAIRRYESRVNKTHEF